MNSLNLDPSAFFRGVPIGSIPGEYQEVVAKLVDSRQGFLGDKSSDARSH